MKKVCFHFRSAGHKKAPPPDKGQGFHTNRILLYLAPLAVSDLPGLAAHSPPARPGPPLFSYRTAVYGLCFLSFWKQQGFLNIPYLVEFFAVEMGVPFRHALAFVSGDTLHLCVRDLACPQIGIQEMPPRMRR
jgi:hypothetical protein